MRLNRWKHALPGKVFLGGVVLLFLATPAPAQGTSGPTTSDSKVGYIDSAVPMDQFRFRFDAAYRDHRPNRAEFFWPKGGPGQPGPLRAETSVDYQDLNSYLELAVNPSLSGFVEAPVRFVNPEVNPNAAGFADMNAGFKWAFLNGEDWLATFQFRTYIPTGNAHRGLGNDHVSLEPALLLNLQLTERLLLEGEFRWWAPIGGTDFAGDILRYGVGLSYGERCADRFWLTPVVELVGWTVLDGQVSFARPGVADGVVVEDASGQTIVNIKFGVRMGLGEVADLYTGYGRTLTGNNWYKDTFRVELRLLF
jgi:hypothetical protein